jgi:hypothetical protein
MSDQKTIGRLKKVPVTTLHERLPLQVLNEGDDFFHPRLGSELPCAAEADKIWLRLVDALRPNHAISAASDGQEDRHMRSPRPDSRGCLDTALTWKVALPGRQLDKTKAVQQ